MVYRRRHDSSLGVDNRPPYFLIFQALCAPEHSIPVRIGAINARKRDHRHCVHPIAQKIEGSVWSTFPIDVRWMHCVRSDHQLEEETSAKPHGQHEFAVESRTGDRPLGVCTPNSMNPILSWIRTPYIPSYTWSVTPRLSSQHDILPLLPPLLP